MTEASADRIRVLAAAALVGQGFPADLVDDVVAEFVVAELAGQRSHGLGKLASLPFGALHVTPRYVSNGAVLSVDGMAGSGLLVMRAVARRLVDLARGNGVALASVRNFSRYGPCIRTPR